MKTLTFKLRPIAQRGFVSIFSIMIIMSILALVTIGFSGITRAAQQRTLDNQLNTQAYYAAESGVNDAQNALKKNPNFTKATCLGQDAPYNNFNYTLDSANAVSYSCALINNKPEDIVLSSVPVEGSAAPKTFALQTDSGATISSFDVFWDATGIAFGNAPLPTPAGTYPAILDSMPNWDKQLGVVRLDMVPMNSALDRNTLAITSHTFFLVPSTNSTRPAGVSQDDNNGTVNQGDLKWVKCASANGKAPCSVNITLKNPVGVATNQYYVRVQSLYSPISFTLKNVRTVGGTINEKLKNGQAVIDVTGKANDVLRRIQVRVSLLQNGFTPAFAMQSADALCKRLQTQPGLTTVDATGIPGPDTAPGGTCAIPTVANP